MMEWMLDVKRLFKKINQLFQAADARGHLRLKTNFRATLSGSFEKFEVTGVNANRDGVAVQSPTEIAPGTLVFIRMSEVGLMGFAHVRHCSKSDGGHLLGLEFRGALSREQPEAENWSRHRVARDAARVWDEAEA